MRVKIISGAAVTDLGTDHPFVPNNVVVVINATGNADTIQFSDSSSGPFGNGKVIPAEQAGKIKFGFQVGSISATFVYLFLFDHVQGPWVSWFGAIHYLGIGLANVITVYSGLVFFYQLARK